MGSTQHRGLGPTVVAATSKAKTTQAHPAGFFTLGRRGGLRHPARPGGFVPNDGEWYADVLAELFDNPGCIGFHLCGAYQRNKARRRGLLDELERPDQENVELIRAANAKVSH